MGLLDGLFKAKLPALDEGTAAAGAITANGAFQSFVKGAIDKMEVVPGAGAIYVYVGNPPKAFGLVWFENGERFDVRSLLGTGALAPESAAMLTRQIRAVYESHDAADRFGYEASSHKVTVTHSDEMYRELRKTIGDALS
jgi:hypothetical protein